MEKIIAGLKAELKTTIAERDDFEDCITKLERENRQLREALLLAPDCFYWPCGDYPAPIPKTMHESKDDWHHGKACQEYRDKRERALKK